jgi:propanol-preferring alcohol dehydrogenase
MAGAGVTGLAIGERVGIPWLGHTDGTCPYCLMHRENLGRDEEARIYDHYGRPGYWAREVQLENPKIHTIP